MPESPVLSSTIFLIVESTTSVERRLWQKTMVATFWRRKRAASLEASPRYGARMPSSGFTTGGL